MCRCTAAAFPDAQMVPCSVSVMDGFNLHPLQLFGGVLRFVYLSL